MNEKQLALAKAREERSINKRRAVEEAINTLKANNEAITFQTIAEKSGVSRPYLYQNFRKEIEALRTSFRFEGKTIDGVHVPSRTTAESQHIEALLRNKIKKLTADLTMVRNENTRMKKELERERGRAEHFRQSLISEKA